MLPGLIDAHTHLLYLEGIGPGPTMEGVKALVDEGLRPRPARRRPGPTFLQAWRSPRSAISATAAASATWPFGKRSRTAASTGRGCSSRALASPFGGQFPGLDPGYQSLAADEYL
ncbi:MAG: hypothetical protein R2882_02340 [Gemmatimonadales bacterium]